MAYQCLVEAGYVPIGFNHFARPGDALAIAAAEGRLQRNFQGYTDDPADVLIGLGASAISDFPELLVQGEKAAGRYRARVATGGLAGGRGVPRTAEDRLRGTVIEALPADGLVALDARRVTAPASALPYSRGGARVRCLSGDAGHALQPGDMSSRVLLALAAIGLGLQGVAAAPAAGREVVICTADGLRSVRLDGAGRPLAPAPDDTATGCAHLWCEPRRPRLARLRRS